MEKFRAQMQVQFDKMCQTGSLFRSQVSGDRLWEVYINSFVNDPIFISPESTSHNCNLCKNFIRRYANIVAIDPATLQLMTIFDFFSEEPEYEPSRLGMARLLLSAPIANVFVETERDLSILSYEPKKDNRTHYKLGVHKNVKRYTKEEAEKFNVVKADTIISFEHMGLIIPKSFISSGYGSIESIQGEKRDWRNVVERGFKEIPLDTLELVRDLILQGSLLNGATYLPKVEAQIRGLKEYKAINYNSLRENWVWLNAHKYPKFKNEVIGTLCMDLAEGKELNAACLSWNKKVDPVNYMKAKAPITQTQINLARKFVEENGYVESFDRRHATIDDIRATEILHLNSSNKEKPISIFDAVQPAKSTRHKRSEFKGIEEVAIDKFIKDILPHCTSVEALLDNKNIGNMVNMTTAKQPDSKKVFKWDNNYSWTFNGNLAGKSEITEAVKSFGGNTEGVLRFSIMWAENNGDNSDLDAHCYFRGGHIHYDNKNIMGGSLDVDIIDPSSHSRVKELGKAVENIVFTKVTPSEYKFTVYPYSRRNSKGFSAEIEFNGELYYYNFPNEVRMETTVATVTWDGEKFNIKHNLTPTDEAVKSTEVYGLNTNEFHKVNLMCVSPNHWGDNEVGNKYYFFMLEGCKCPHDITSFHTENLNAELVPHRKVIEALSFTTKLEPADKQLAGLGFNATVQDELIVKVQGSHKRMLKIKF